MEKEIFEEELWPEDKALFASMKGQNSTSQEKEFFEKMEWKEKHENVATVDIILSEDTNDDELYIVRQGDAEYKAGRGHKGHRRPIAVDGWCLAVFLQQDLFPLLDRHVTVLEWLREHNFAGINYEGSLDDM